MSTLKAKIIKTVNLQEGELKPFAWSFVYFFSLLCSYYILRPIRDEMGIQGGVRNLQWIFTATFVAMLVAVPVFGWATRRFQRATLVPVVNFFFILNLVGFYLAFNSPFAGVWVGRVFFIWVSVFNLFVVSIFWSFMADIFTGEQAGRLFGVIAAGGSAGAIAGPAITTLLGTVLGPVHLLPLSIGFLILAIVCVRFLILDVRERGAVGRKTDKGKETPIPLQQTIEGGVFAGMIRVIRSPYLAGIVAFILFYTTLSTFLYFEQAHIIKDAFADPAERTRVFAGMDLVVNILTVLAQLFFTSRLVLHRGVAFALALIPIVLAAGLLVLGFFPVLPVLLGIQILRRAGNYAVTRPAREMLFTVLDPRDKYKSKNFIDTVAYRGGDALSGWAFAGLKAAGLGISAITFIAVPLAVLWAGLAWILGKQKEKIEERGPGADTLPSR